MNYLEKTKLIRIAVIELIENGDIDEILDKYKLL